MSNWLASLLMTADNKKIVAYNVYNTETKQLKPIPVDKFMEVLKTNPNAVENARISSDGKLETDGALERYNKFATEATNKIKLINQNQVMNYIVLGYARDTKLKTFLLLNPYTGQVDVEVEAVIESALTNNKIGLANAKLSNGSIVGLGKPLPVFNTADYRYNKYTKSNGKIQIIKEEDAATLIGYYGYRNSKIDEFNYLIDVHMNLATDTIDVLIINEQEIKTDKFASGQSLTETSALRIDLRNKAKSPLNIKKLMIDLRDLTVHYRYKFARNIFIECNTECNIEEVELALGQLRISSLNFGANINDISRFTVSEISAKTDYATGNTLYITRDSFKLATNSGFNRMSRETKLRTNNEDLTFRRVELGASKITKVIFDEYVYFKEIYDTRKKDSEVLNVYGFGKKGYTISNLGKQNIQFELTKPRIYAADTLSKLNLTLGNMKAETEVEIDKADIELDELNIKIIDEFVSQLGIVSNQSIKTIHIKKLNIICNTNKVATNLELVLFNLQKQADVYIDELNINNISHSNFIVKMPNVTVHTKTNSNIIAFCEKNNIKYIIDDLRKSDEIYGYKAKMFGSSVIDVLANDIVENYRKSMDGQFEKVEYTLTGKEKVLTDNIITCFNIQTASDKIVNTNATSNTVVQVDKAFKNIIETLKALFGNITNAIEGNYVLDNLAYTYLKIDKTIKIGYNTSIKVVESCKFDNASIQILGTDNDKLGLEMQMCYIIAEIDRKIVYFNYIPKEVKYISNTVVARNITKGICLHGVMNKDILNELVHNNAIMYVEKDYSIAIGNMEQKLDLSDIPNNFLQGTIYNINTFFSGMFTMHIVDMKKHKAVYIAIDAEGTVIQLDITMERIKEYGRTYDIVKSAKFVPVDITEIKKFMINHTKDSLLLKIFRQCPNERLDKIEKMKEEALNKINIQEVENSASTEEAIIKLFDTNLCYDSSKLDMLNYETETVKVTDNIYKIQAHLYDNDDMPYYEYAYYYNKKGYYTVCNLEELVNQVRRNKKPDRELLNLEMNNIYCFHTTEIYHLSNYFTDLCLGDNIKDFIVDNSRKRNPITSLKVIADANGRICLAALYYSKTQLYLIPLLELKSIGALIKNTKESVISDLSAVNCYTYSNKQLRGAIEKYIKYLTSEGKCKVISNTAELSVYETDMTDIDVTNNDIVYIIKGLLILKGNKDDFEKQANLFNPLSTGTTLLNAVHITYCDTDKIYWH
mgnify:CR=1 FL=1